MCTESLENRSSTEFLTFLEDTGSSFFLAGWMGSAGEGEGDLNPQGAFYPGVKTFIIYPYMSFIGSIMSLNSLVSASKP